jgi:AIPR protein
MAILHIGHIKAALLKRFDGQIDLSDLGLNPTTEDQENFFLTRSLAAFLVAELAEVDDKIAAKAVVDGSGDNGIDAFYFDATERVCYLVQSKWIHNGKGSIEVGAVHKFLQGVTDLLEAKLDHFDKLKQKKPEIDAALTDSSATFVLVIGYTGEQSMSSDALRPIEEFLKEQNDPTELISFKQLRQADLHSIVARQAIGESVKLTVLLHEWGKVTEPYPAYYGMVDLQDIETWRAFGQALYTRNLRGFKGSTDVNEGIVKTARYAPENFWYFNNGITILCDKLSKQPLGGSSRESGVFECEGASVVNGAQTVGSILSALDGGPNGFHRARVSVRIIDLEKCPPSFAIELTRAANTQNRIEKKDFAAQDPEQDRLKTELLLECSKVYAYKTGDHSPLPEEGCTFDDAVVALACAQQDSGLCVQAKREVGQLYDDITQTPYKKLFNASVSALKLWRAVEIMRVVGETLREQANLEGKDRLIAVHGNRFILHLVFRALNKFDSVPQDEFEKMKKRIPEIALEMLASTTAEKETQAKGSYPANVFKNASKCKGLAEAILPAKAASA